MFIRVKKTPNSPRKSVQIVESYRVGKKVRQKIVKHIGVALDDEQLEELKALANTIKIKLELDTQLSLYAPEDIAKLEKYNKKPSKKSLNKDKEALFSADNQADTVIVDSIMSPFVKTTFKSTLIPPNYDTFSNKSILPNTLLFTPLSVPLKYVSSGVA